MKIKWLDKPQKHDYTAAASYLGLTMDDTLAQAVSAELERALMSAFAAKDIFRASGLSLLGVSDSHVERDRTRIIREEKLSPVLLHRDKINGRLIIADGYHRLCAVYKFDEDAMIPARSCENRRIAEHGPIGKCARCRAAHAASDASAAFPG